MAQERSVVSRRRLAWPPPDRGAAFAGRSTGRHLPLIVHVDVYPTCRGRHHAIDPAVDHDASTTFGRISSRNGSVSRRSAARIGGPRTRATTHAAPRTGASSSPHPIEFSHTPCARGSRPSRGRRDRLLRDRSGQRLCLGSPASSPNLRGQHSPPPTVQCSTSPPRLDSHALLSGIDPCQEQVEARSTPSNRASWSWTSNRRAGIVGEDLALSPV